MNHENSSSYKFKPTDAGRSNSKRSKQTYDCTVRALTVALSLDYDVAYDYLASRGRKSSRGANFPNRAKDDECFGYTFKWTPFPAVKGETRMNPVKFSKWFANGTYIVKTAKHVTAVIDGVFHDDIRMRPDRCIYGAWKVEVTQ